MDVLNKQQRALADAIGDAITAEKGCNPDLSLCDIHAVLSYLADKASDDIAEAMFDEGMGQPVPGDDEDPAERWKRGGDGGENIQH